MIFPIKLKYDLPKPGDAGFFGAVRKHDIHTGIDLYCDDGDNVYAMEDGVIVRIEKFTGEHADSPWWNNTWAVLIEGNSGVIVYGEIIPNELINLGNKVQEGQLIGTVRQVLKRDKGINPPSMLHIELMRHGCYNTLWWKHNDMKPLELINPIKILNLCQ